MNLVLANLFYLNFTLFLNLVVDLAIGTSATVEPFFGIFFIYCLQRRQEYRQLCRAFRLRKQERYWLEIRRF